MIESINPISEPEVFLHLGDAEVGGVPRSPLHHCHRREITELGARLNDIRNPLASRRSVCLNFQKSSPQKIS